MPQSIRTLARIIVGAAVFVIWLQLVGNPHVVETVIGLVIAIAAPTRGTARDSAVAPPPLAPAELSREWRRTPRAITFDHMFRNNTSPAGAAWIREGGGASARR